MFVNLEHPAKHLFDYAERKVCIKLKSTEIEKEKKRKKEEGRKEGERKMEGKEMKG